MAKKQAAKRIVCIMAMICSIHAAGVSSTTEWMKAVAEDEEITALPYETIPVTSFRVSNLSPKADSDMDYTDWWYSKWETCRYIYLPAAADRTELTITYETEGDVPLFLNDIQVVSGEPTALLSEADEFRITVGETDCGTVRVMQSNLGCVFINTSNGSLDYLDSHWWFNETGTTMMLNAEGAVTYSGELAKITSHGNSSWDYSEKKSYNIKLPGKEDLYGMGKAKRWVLVSNYLDHSMLRNKIGTEMSRKGGMEFAMDSTYVDLYSDGSYRGTYLLSERVQIQKQRVNITDLEEETEKYNPLDLKEYPHKVVGAADFGEYMENSYKYYEIPNDPKDITGGYLLQFQLCGRYGPKAESGFITSRGQPVEIDGPEYASEAQVLYIRNFMQELEDAIYSDNGCNSLGKHYSEYMDVDSLIAAYLVQEISMNADGTKTSFYMWKESDQTGDGKLHFGPAWDFDFSLGNYGIAQKNSYGEVSYSTSTENLYIAGFPIEGYGTSRPTLGISWIGQLYKHGDIVTRAANMYAERFVPYLNELIGSGNEDALITQMAQDILPSARMNNARWYPKGGWTGSDFTDNAAFVRNYLEKRKVWLDKLWMPLVTDEGYYMEGDVNADGRFAVTDVIVLQRWLLCGEYLPCWRAGDLCEDGEINAFDLVMMKRKLLGT